MIRLVTFVLAGLAVAFVAIPADASTHMWQELASGSINALSDDSFETLWNKVNQPDGTFIYVQATDPSGDVTIDEGDIIGGVFNINAITSPVTKTYLADWDNEFTGVFQLEVLSKSDTPNGTVTTPSGTFNKYDFEFGPASVNVLSLTNWTLGVDMVATFSDPAGDFLNPYPLSSATGGVEGWRFGFPTGTAAAGEGWTTNGVDTLAPYLNPNTPSTLRLGDFQVAINVTNTPAYLVNYLLGLSTSVVDFTPDSVALNGTGQLFKSPASGWPVKDNLDLEIYPTIVPEPASLLVWTGLGLVAFAARRRRRG